MRSRSSIRARLGIAAISVLLCSACQGARTSGDASRAVEIELEPSGDIELDEMRRLAVKAPLDELCDKATPFLSLRIHSYREDRILWLGVARLAREIVENPTRSFRRNTVLVVIGQIEKSSPPPELRLHEYLPRLRARCPARIVEPPLGTTRRKS